MAEAAYARAQNHLAASRFADAANEMDIAVRYEPRFAFGWYVLASARRRAGDCDRAIAAYRRYMELRPAEPDPHFGAGLCLQTVGDRAAALAAFSHYLQTDQRPASASFIDIARKRVAELQRATTATTATTAAAVAASPVLVEARQLREHGRTEDAIAKYRAAVAADAKSADARAELGALLVSARRAKDAVDELRAAVRLAPTVAPAWYNLGFALRETGQTEEAVTAYRRYITFKPKDPDPHYGLGRALAALGRDDEALVAFRAYTSLETRPTERRWLKKARAEITRIEATRPPAAAAAGSPAFKPPKSTAPSALTAPPTLTAPAAMAPAPTAPAPTAPAPTAPAPTAPTAKAKSAPPTEPTPAGHP